MNSLTEIIESYINQLFEHEPKHVSLRRKDLAEHFGCVPSQINYVLQSRFTPERGFLVESQRGGHGYIRILKISYEMPEERARHIDEIIGDSISDQDIKRLLGAFQSRGFLSVRERLLIEVSLRYIDDLSNEMFDISPYKKSVLKAGLLKRMLCGLDLS